MSDKPVLPLTLYRITLETDTESTALRLRDFFCGYDGISKKELDELRKNIIGVETRVRERVRHE